MEPQYTYVDNVNSNLMCCICRMAFVRPTITATCFHTFCNDCIIAALSVSPQCPVDRSPLTEADLRPANPIVRSLVDELVVECTNHQYGCRHTCQRQLLAAHLRDECDFVQIPCGEKECQELISRKNVVKHSSICIHRVISCRGCGCQVKAVNIEGHYEMCSNEEIPCSHCKTIYHLSKLEQHESSCPDMIVNCGHATHGCPWSGKRSSLSSHTSQCPYESIKDFFSQNARRISFLETENLSLRNRIEALENTLRLAVRDLESTKIVLGPWFAQGGESEAVRLPESVEAASRAYNRSSSGISTFGFGFGPESNPSPLDTSSVNAFDTDPLSRFFPPESNAFDAPPAHTREGTYRQPLSSSIAPLNLNTSLVGSLNSLRSSLVTLASSLDSEVRRHDIALVSESSRVSEEVMALRAVVHGLRMQVHQIMMDRNSQVTGAVDGSAPIIPAGDFGLPNRYLNYGHPPIHRSTNTGTTSYIQHTKL